MGAAQTNAGFFFSFDRMCRSPCAGNSQMNDDQQNTVLSKASVFGLPDEPPMTALHCCYWLLASGRTLLDGFSVVSLGIAISAEGFMRFSFAIPPLRA